MPAGRIKKIIPDRGFGFVRADDGNEVFFHRTELTLVDFDQLEEGRPSSSTSSTAPRGRGRAISGRPADPQPSPLTR